MWTISVVMGPASFALLYKTEEPWIRACEQLDLVTNGTSATLTDDFGQRLTVRGGMFGGYVAEDLEQSKLARVEFALHQQRTTILAQKMAENDNTIRTAKMMQAPVLHPNFGIPSGGRQ